MSTTAIPNDECRPDRESDSQATGGNPRHRLISDRKENALFHQLRTRCIHSMLRTAMATSRLRLSVLIVLSAVFWAGLFLLFAEGFTLLNGAITHLPRRARMVQDIYNVFFMTLLAMLTVSSSLIIYSGLYRTDDVRFLLTTPASCRRIVLFKFQESLVFSCWGFFLMGTPMLIAYGAVADSPWYYFALLLPFMVAFVCIPVSLGSILCMLVVYFAPRLRFHLVGIVGVVGLVAAIWIGWSTFSAARADVLTSAWLDDMRARLQFADQRLLPSWWLSCGLLEAAHRETVPGLPETWRESVMFLGVLISNALVGGLLVGFVGQRTFRRGYSRLQGAVSPYRSARGSSFDRWLLAAMKPMPTSVRLMIVKDLRLFRRDPVQWAQFVIFFGLLALYFINIRRFQYGDNLQHWINMIGFLNLSVVGLILSTFTTRFIFPMISLEGRRFWMLGSLAINRDTVLWSKFLFACFGSIVPCASLILLSDAMLGIVTHAPFVAVIHQITCWVLCIGLSAIAVGLGARLPNLRESSPSRIAAGFGGTLNLVLSALFIITTVMVSAVPTYCYLQPDHAEALIKAGPTALWLWLGIGSIQAVYLSLSITILLGVIATVIPLQLGIRAFRRLEF